MKLLLLKAKASSLGGGHRLAPKEELKEKRHEN
jgi:hypothetical protein